MEYLDEQIKNEHLDIPLLYKLACNEFIKLTK